MQFFLIKGNLSTEKLTTHWILESTTTIITHSWFATYNVPAATTASLTIADFFFVVPFLSSVV